MPLRYSVTIGLLAGIVALPVPAWAGGFYLQEQSPKETGRALSGGAAAADDPSTVYFNPAAMTQLPGIQTSVGAVALMATAHQSNRGSSIAISQPATGPIIGFPPPPSVVNLPIAGNSGGNPFDRVIPVPSFYATAQLTDRLWLGLGVNAPFGLKLDYDDGFFGRYDSLHSELKTYNIQPSAALKLGGGFSVGGGVDVQYTKVTLTSALPQFANGLATVKGKDWSTGWNAGILYTGGGTNVGLHYRSAITHHLTGTQTLSGLPALLVPSGRIESPASAPLALPDIATLSLMHRLTPHLRAMLTARWYNWSRFQTIAITTPTQTSVKELHYRDSYSFSVGGEYDVSPALTLRAGTMFDRTPTNPQYLTTRVPDGDRSWLSGGATWNMSPALALNVSYAHNFVEKTTIIRPDMFSSGGASITTTTRSMSSGNVDQIAASVTARF